MAAASTIISQTPGASSSQDGRGDLAMSSLTQVSGASIFWLRAIHLATPAGDAHHPHGDDERARAARRVMRTPLTNPIRPPVRTPKADGQERRQAGVDGVGGDDAGQGDVGRGRQVDAAADDDEGHAQRAQGHDHGLGGHGS